MGTYYDAYYYKLSHKERRKIMDDLYTWTATDDAGKDTCYSVVDSTIKNGVYYAAVCKNYNYGETVAITAAVCILRQYRENGVFWYGYKPMDETFGPYDAECPRRILDKLSPTENENARQWRERCRRNAGRRSLSSLPEGSIISFISPYDTRSGVKAGDVVELEKIARGITYSARTGRTRTRYIWSRYPYSWSSRMIPKDFTIVKEGVNA